MIDPIAISVAALLISAFGLCISLASFRLRRREKNLELKTALMSKVIELHARVVALDSDSLRVDAAKNAVREGLKEIGHEGPIEPLLVHDRSGSSKDDLNELIRSLAKIKLSEADLLYEEMFHELAAQEAKLVEMEDLNEQQLELLEGLQIYIDRHKT